MVVVHLPVQIRPSGERHDDWRQCLTHWMGVGMPMRIFVLEQWYVHAFVCLAHSFSWHHHIHALFLYSISNIKTTQFGIFDADAGFKGGEMPNLRDASSLARSVLQPGNKLLAAGYCLYSSTTMLVFTLGGGTHGFTLDPSIQEFVLTHPNMKIPSRGNIYSCNEAYSEGWDGNFQRYLRNLKSGKGETRQRYTQRYIGSMVGDVHRTLTYGGLYCYPSDTDEHPKGQLQLVYKSAPMAYILEHAGGKATNGKINLLDVQPGYVHERSPCFMGSPEDMDELMTYMSNDA